LPKSREQKIGGEIWNPSPASRESLQKEMSPELARVYELPKTVTILLQKLKFHKINAKSDECLENYYLTFCRHHEITALADKKYPI
jgi:hypothetical protein